MNKKELKYYQNIFAGIFLIGLGFLFPYMTNMAWFNILLKIKRSISTGDSGLLILSAASMSFLYAIQNTFLFLGTILLMYYTKLMKTFSWYILFTASLAFIISMLVINSVMFKLPWEPVSTIMSLILNLLIFKKFYKEKNSFIHISIVAIQIFFAFQWLNIMPLFSSYKIGVSDIPCSIKIAGLYLHASSVLDFTGLAFFIPFVSSAFMTCALFLSYLKNIKMLKQNYEKEREIQNMKAKILENKILKEVKSLVHDLKTPLVTIQGLTSLLALSKDTHKLGEYSERIENSVSKMNEMISSFLYDTSRQKLPCRDLISYIRAQLPLEDDTVEIDIHIDEELPFVYINKVRIARAVINVLENALVIPFKQPYKHITFEVKSVCGGVNIIVSDNGIGIKEEELPRIWEIGYSTNNTSGLGLPFVKQVIEDNEGTVDILSKWQVGTTVTIFLPSKEDILENDA